MWTPVIAVLVLSAAAAATLSCDSLDTRKWKHARSSTAPAYAMGAELNLAAYKDKARLDGRAFEARTDEELRGGLPIAFDARRHWRRCPSIARIADQGCCGSCWAYAAAMAMTDRQCIHAHSQFEYSPAHLLGCSKLSNATPPCTGGDPADAFDYWVARGVVSGGGFNSYAGCMPYSFPPAGKRCEDANTKVECINSCTASYPLQLKSDLHYGERYMLLPQNRSVVMQAEIMRGGPIVAILETYEDFKCYEGGVYEHVAGALQGAHAVRLLGWGTENGVPYWLAANTWGRAWGERGTFKVRRGTNECGIESMRVVTGYPSMADYSPPTAAPASAKTSEEDSGKDYPPYYYDDHVMYEYK